MPELTDPDGKPLDPEGASVNTEFARAMAAEAPGEETAAPPRRQRAEPAAPPKRRGRPPKAERARVESGPAKAASGPLSDEQRAQGVKGLVQIGAGLALVANRATGAEAFKADAITLASGADDLAAACVETAKTDERFARLVDKVCAVGPYGALLGAVMGIGTQLIRNHKPGAALPGTVDPADLIRAAERQQAEQFEAEQQAA